jgi:tRNA threonylcarbamoyladenosine biosynthesis protein TsaE
MSNASLNKPDESSQPAILRQDKQPSANNANLLSRSMVLELPDAAATRSLGLQLGRTLPVGSVLLLQGDLGAGKTTLVQGLAEGLAIPDAIDSPTFTLINEYQGGRIPLYHLDLYRLDPAATADLYPEVYWEGIEVEPGIVAIEWPERLPYRPDRYLEMHLTHTADGGRRLELFAVGMADLPLLSSN